MAKLGYAPPLVDQMELWQAASLLGIDEGETLEEGQLTFMGRPVSQADYDRAMRFSGISDDNEDITDQVMRQMGINPG